MKLHRKKHDTTVVRKALSNHSKTFSEDTQYKSAISGIPHPDELARLNHLASERPFCSWKHHKSNDPL